MTEGPTLLPAIRSDKRTKEVFVLSLERMSAGSSAGIGRPIDVVDEGLSREWITPRPCRSELAREEREYAALNQTKRVIVHVFREQARSYRGAVTVVVLVIVLVLNQYFSFRYKGLFLPGFQNKPSVSWKPVFNRLKRIFSLLPVFTDVDL